MDGVEVLPLEAYTSSEFCIIRGPAMYYGLALPAGLCLLFTMIIACRMALGILCNKFYLEVIQVRDVMVAVRLFTSKVDYSFSIIHRFILVLEYFLLCFQIRWKLHHILFILRMKNDKIILEYLYYSISDILNFHLLYIGSIPWVPHTVPDR